jgi:UDP-N-acetylglucosamine transferase subunit ALG13
VIFVMLGTNPYPFDRLLKAVDLWAADSGEKVVAQTGHTKLAVSHIECHDFASHERMIAWIQEAELVIAQGGFGSLRDCLVAGKPTIAVPRLPERGECQDRQSEIVDALATEGRVIALYDEGQLSRAIEQVRQLPAVEPSQSNIPRIVSETVEAVLR